MERTLPPFSRRAILFGLATVPFGLSGRRAGADMPAVHSRGMPAVHSRGGFALGGIDPVSYFTETGPVPGQAEHALIWHGAHWLFASSANRDRFEMAPRQLSPRFGCYCAQAMSEGELASGDPEAFMLHEGRLYIAHDRAARDLWRADPAGHVARAEAYWPDILSTVG